MATTIKSTAQHSFTATATFGGYIHAESIQVDGGGVVTMFQKYQTSINFGSVSGNGTATATFSAPGVTTTNCFTIVQQPNSIPDVFAADGTVTAADVIEISLHNTSITVNSAATATYNVLAIRFAT